MDDPDAPAGTWVHWVVYDLPAEARSLPEGLPKSPELSDGGKQGESWGVDRFERVGYAGPLPPEGQEHRYVLTLYALDDKTGLSAGATKDEVMRAVDGHTLASAQLTATFAR